jgi:hypothetical protein
MRNTTLIVAGALLLGAALLSWWPAQTNSVTDAPPPPGQYPLDAARYEWPAKARTAAYRPSNSTGSNDAAIAGTKDAKAICALSSTCPQ